MPSGRGRTRRLSSPEPAPAKLRLTVPRPRRWPRGDWRIYKARPALHCGCPAIRCSCPAQSHLGERTGGVGELLDLVRRNARAVKHRDQDVRVRCVLLVVQVLVALDAAATTDQRLRQWIVVVGVAV